MAVEWRKRTSMSGFTLVEIMVVIAIISILATLGMRGYTRHIFASSLEGATPYLMSIAAKERIYFNERGTFYFDTDEQGLEDNLGVNLQDAPNYCFMVVDTDVSPISASAPADGFEVWALLRDTNYSAGTSDNDSVNEETGITSCITADVKNAANNYYEGKEGRVLVLRYPPPGDNIDTNDRTNRATIRLDWVGGISTSDALLD